MTVSSQWEPHFSRDSFATALKYWRSINGLSQLELVEALSLSHRAFQGVNQPMLSKWEHGNGQPSLMRRAGVAAFFQLPYRYNEEELRLIQGVKKYDELFIGNNPVYPCTIEEFASYSWNQLPALFRDQIEYAQQHYRNISFDDLISAMSIKELHVVVALHHQAMVGHIVYGKDDNGQDCLLSYLAKDKLLHRKVHRHVCQLFDGKKILLAAVKPYAKTLLSDIYIPEKYQIGELSVFECDLTALHANPFFEQLHDEGRVLSLLSHHQKVQRERRTPETTD
ncbi:helix-turn-helix domain-containing protein [Vibrio sp. CB1-14]|uniref:Helix-turn-helix domain-containing protein n=1 Tax=Vibrio chaetopteri TaxID=3016528 RepID=A0AAU8BJX6_9VIBR